MRYLLLAGLLTLLGAGPALAGAIEVVHPWARPTIPNRPGVVYLGIHNTGAATDRLIGARAEGVEAVELHLARQQDGVMTMRPVEAIEIPAGGMAHLGPGGYHLMLFGIAEPLTDGESLSLTLVFEAAGEIAVSVPVSRTAGEPDHHGSGQGHGHGHGQGDSSGN